MDITDFILARIAEDEVDARTATVVEGAERWDIDWRYSEPDGIITARAFGNPGYQEPYRITQDSEGLSPSVTDWAAAHIARWDPARVLAECKAKRRIVAAFDNDGPWRGHRRAERAQEVAILTALALPYAEHPDYRDEWRP